MKMIYSYHIANYLFDLAKSKKIKLSPVQMNALVYLTYGWHLAVKNYELTYDKPKVYSYGPIFDNLFYALKKYGSKKISDKIKQGDMRSKIPPSGLLGDPLEGTWNDEQKLLMNRIFEVYKDYSEDELCILTIQPGTPWHTCYVKKGMVHPVTMPLPILKKYYHNQAKKSKLKS